MKRRQFIQLLGGAAVGVTSIFVPNRTLFLPPLGGWPRGRTDALASLIIPQSDIHYWAEEIASGQMAYDVSTNVLSLLKASPPVSIAWEHMSTPNEWTVAEEIIADEWGNFARGGAVPIRYSLGDRAARDDARELARMEEERRVLLAQYPSLVSVNHF